MTQVRIEQWTEHDLDLVVAMNAPELMTELGGPETDEKLVERHNRYFSGWERGTSWMFRIMVGDEKVGGAGFWTTEWQGEDVYETGWTVLGAFQGRGVASAAVALVLEQAAKKRERRYVHALPKIKNAPSNAVCRKVGFTLLGPIDDEYPPGNPIRSNDWVYDLRTLQPR